MNILAEPMNPAPESEDRLLRSAFVLLRYCGTQGP